MFGARYADEAKTLARKQSDPARRRELERIAEICAAVPAHPPRNFREALQAFWFTQVLLYINSPDWSISPGRFDQYMWPYYRHDIDVGAMTRSEAEELLACLWIKFNDVRV